MSVVIAIMAVLAGLPQRAMAKASNGQAMYGN
jgi:hypothetical protein